MFKSDLMKSWSFLRISTLIWALHQKLTPVVFAWHHQTLPELSLKMMTVSVTLTYKHYMLYTSERDHIFWTVLCVVGVTALALVLSDSVSVSIHGSVIWCEPFTSLKKSVFSCQVKRNLRLQKEGNTSLFSALLTSPKLWSLRIWVESQLGVRWSIILVWKPINLGLIKSLWIMPLRPKTSEMVKEQEWKVEPPGIEPRATGIPCHCSATKLQLPPATTPRSCPYVACSRKLLIEWW